jgi:hypothetical protein
MNIAAQFQQITVLVHQDGFESPLVQVSDPAVTAIVIAGIGNIKLPHEFRQVGLGRLDNQVKVVAHQDVGVYADAEDD